MTAARQPAAPQWDTGAMRAAELDLLSNISIAMQTASTDPAPVKQRVETSSGFQVRFAKYAATCGMVEFKTPHGNVRLLNQRERLERFARDVHRCGGYRPSRPHGIGRERESWQALQPATERDTIRLGRLPDDELATLLATRKAHALDIMRKRWQGADCSAHVRLMLARDIELVQREMVRRGLLDATDHDKVNAEPVQETVDAPPPVAVVPPAPAPAARAPRPARVTQAPPASRGAFKPDDVEMVEVIETTNGKLTLVIFDEEFEILGYYPAFELRLRTFEDLRTALAAPAAGPLHDWPAASKDAQARYDRLTEHRANYNVIGRWSRLYGMDLQELSLSRLLGRAPRARLAA